MRQTPQGLDPGAALTHTLQSQTKTIRRFEECVLLSASWQQMQSAQTTGLLACVRGHLGARTPIGRV